MSDLYQTYLKAAIAAQTNAERDLAEIRQFYDGEQIKHYGKSEAYLAEVFREMFIKYPAANLVKTTVNIATERLAVKSLAGGTKSQLATAAGDWWKAARLDSWQDDLYAFALRDSAAVLIVDWDESRRVPTFAVNELWDGTGGNCRIHFDDTGNVAFVSKRWNVHDERDRYTGKTRLTLYFADRIERWISTSLAGWDWRLMSPAELNGTPNPMPWIMPDGTPIGIAAVPFFNRPYESECAVAMTPQTLLNEAILSWHATGRFHGFPMLAIEGSYTPEKDAQGNPKPFETGPGRVIKTGGGALKRVEPTDMLALFEGAVIPAVKLVAMSKRWPDHAFAGMPPSGETLRQMEGPLVSQVEAKQRVFGDSWRDAFSVAQRLYEANTGEKLAGEIDVQWKSALAVSAKYDAEVVGARAAAGQLPRKQRWRELGFGGDEIAQMEAEYQADLEQSAKALLSDQIIGVR